MPDTYDYPAELERDEDGRHAYRQSKIEPGDARIVMKSGCAVLPQLGGTEVRGLRWMTKNIL